MSDLKNRLLLRRYAETQSPLDAMAFAEDCLRTSGQEQKIEISVYVVLLIENYRVPNPVLITLQNGANAIFLTEQEARDYIANVELMELQEYVKENPTLPLPNFPDDFKGNHHRINQHYRALFGSEYVILQFEDVPSGGPKVITL